MAGCLKCGGDAGYQFHVLEVQTLHVRDFGGEKRVQALGLYQDYAVCESCARAYLEAARTPGKAVKKTCAAFGAVGLLGIVLAAAFWSSDRVILLLGLAALACGVLGVVSTIRTGKKRSAEYAALPEGEALHRAAWECMVAHAPKKAGENDLTYIPVTEKTLAMKNGDLMIAFDLLPGVAKKAYELIHGE